ncbi:MAG: hypothetical protein GY948_05310 [Alphaproteobacteria bacterium]|nr:hypothetical protein [Alphaproteobacteria bacterium]
MQQEKRHLEPARSILKAFEREPDIGIDEVAEITGRDRTRVLRWMYPKDKGGTGGTIPSSSAQELYREAAQRKLPLKADDFFLDAPLEDAE